jgi:hypothetical protein
MLLLLLWRGWAAVAGAAALMAEAPQWLASMQTK